MHAQETRSILTIALMAAFADGLKDERERAAVKRVAEALGPDAGFDLPGAYRDVLLTRPDLREVASQLQTPEARQLAFEMAVAICDADGVQVPAEKDFLQKLGAVLDLDHGAAAAASDAAEAVAEAAYGQGHAAAAVGAGAPEGGATVAPATVSGTVTGRASMPDAEMDKLILDAAVTNAALELLPETLATMAIIPLQMRLVYRIGRSYGYVMDTSHAKDFVATLGIGLTSQYIEQFGRKLLGGLLGGVGGGLGRAVGRQAASSGLTFATTYALGRVAQRYYAGGRTLDGETLKQTFTELLAEARALAPGYRAEIEQKAGTIDMRSLASLVRHS